MADEEQKYGKLIGPGIKIQRQYFNQMLQLLGIKCIFKAPDPKTRHYNTHGELETSYLPGKVVYVIFENHPDQKTLRKRGWVTELQTESSMIHVPYDLEGLEAGALFIIPSGLDNSKGRVFRVIRMQNIMIYPASIACEIAPEYESTNKEATNITKDYSKTTQNVLVDHDDED